MALESSRLAIGVPRDDADSLTYDAMLFTL